MSTPYQEKLSESELGQQEMMADIAHGLQTPLTIIKGELHFLKKEMPESKRILVCERMVHEMSFLIYDLLHLARLDRTDISQTLTPIDLSVLVSQVEENISIMAGTQGVLLKADIIPGIMISGLEERIEELIINIISNSMKYMDDSREKKIAITLQTQERTAILTVQDTGLGISAEDLPHVFTRFYRVKNKQTLSQNGSGLGLAIAKKIAEKHDATITLESKLGKGTTVVVTFPLLQKEASV